MNNSKIKQTAVLVALDIHIRRIKKSPERCARNLIELGTNAFPDKINKKEQEDLLKELLSICKKEEIQNARELFIKTFLPEH